MKSSKALSRARKEASALSRSKQQTQLLARAASSSASLTTSIPAPTSSQSQRQSLLLPSHRVNNALRTFPSYATPLRTTQSRHYASAPDSLSTGPLSKTALYDLHLAHGAKMVPFGGFEMPVQYSGLGVSASHHFTREKASLFDVGHMVQHRFEGPGAAAFLQRVTPGSIAALPAHQSTLSTLLWPGSGGIVDDTVITRLGPELFYVVTNAACRDKDLKYLAEQLEAWRNEAAEGKEKEVRHEVLDGWGLVALQGPLAEDILAELLLVPEEAKLRELYFGQSRFVKLKLRGSELSRPVLVSRGGYTGEDGFEISIAPEDTVAITEALLQTAGPERLQLAGLGARDSLRLEAGMCLYGHDLDDTTTPVEGALSWIIGKDRRDPAAADKFHGADAILAQLKSKSKGGQGVERRRVGFVIEGAPAREGAEIVDGADGGKIGVVTSGCPSPTLGKNIAMGYVKDGSHKAGTEVEVVVRGRKRKAVVTKMPFVATKYWKGTAPA
ncbi:Uu.00g046130.m01.CDS01 [Anthostomella pinea]|uniref:Aminomethyltransferase n=1 Tax=Anthostomella pinea TaxID=933095 RepID=A0AAI8VC90_9PEZI|nr:Uu.00g046130.m01.CDS01 [Anthostomella pinea]